MPIIIVVIVLLIVVSVGPKIFTWAKSHTYIYTTTTIPARDVTLVFGAAMWGDVPSPYLQSRLDLAADWYKAGKTKVIIVSGSNIDGDDEPDGMKAALLQEGIPASQIVLDFGGLDTYSSCIRARDVYGVQSITLVTQSYHLPRALATCRGLGLDAVGIGDDTQERNLKYYKYQVREVLADAKMMLDLATHRRLADATPSDDVTLALANS